MDFFFFIKVCEKEKKEREIEKKRNNVLSHVPNLCNHILVNGVIWLLTERRIRWERERERERERGERRLKYIELLKGLPAVHHCHLTHVECEVPSQQPLGGHLLPHTRVHGHSHTHTHTHKHVQSDTPNFYIQRKKENCLLLLKAAHNQAYMHTQCRSPAIFTRLPRDSNTHIWTCLHLSNWTCIVFCFFSLLLLFEEEKKEAGLLKLPLPRPISIIPILECTD